MSTHLTISSVARRQAPSLAAPRAWLAPVSEPAATAGNGVAASECAKVVLIVSILQYLVVLAGLAWLLIVVAMPGHLVGGSGWALVQGVQRWRNGWIWALLLSTGLGLAGEFCSALLSCWLLPSLGYGIWLLIVGRDLASLVCRLTSPQGGLAILKKALNELPLAERLTYTVGFYLVFLAFPLFITAISLIHWRFPVADWQGLSAFTISFQLMIILRVHFESAIIKRNESLSNRRFAPGTIVTWALAPGVVVAAVLSIAYEREPTLLASLPFLWALSLALDGWGSKSGMVKG